MDLADMKVGELARRTGVSVRTLHHYHEIGLLVPSLHAHGDHRLYSKADVVRLQQIVSLKQLGLSLAEIRSCLERPGSSPLEVLEMHVRCLEERIEHQARVRERLVGLVARLRAAEEPTGEELLKTIEVMNEMEQYYTPEQLEDLRQRREALGPEGMERAHREWAELIAKVQAAHAAGEDPRSPKVRALAQRWHELVEAFTGGDPGIRASLAKMYEEQPDVAQRHGYRHDPELTAWLAKARE